MHVAYSGTVLTLLYMRYLVTIHIIHYTVLD
jgi:hypothetical protein